MIWQAVRRFDRASQRGASDVVDAGDGPRYGVAVPTRPHPTVGLHVVETWDGLAFLGSIRKRGSVVTVKSGLVGRPAVLHLDEIMSITAAEEHPDVDTDDTITAAREGVAAAWLRGLAVDIVAHESCRECRVNAAQALDELGLLHLLGEAGLADPRTEPVPQDTAPSGANSSALTFEMGRGVKHAEQVDVTGSARAEGCLALLGH